MIISILKIIYNKYYIYFYNYIYKAYFNTLNIIFFFVFQIYKNNIIFILFLII